MSHYSALELVAFLEVEGCQFDGDAYAGHEGWFTEDGQVFVLPEPYIINGEEWFDADVIDEMCANRWLGFTTAGNLGRHYGRSPRG